MFVKDFKELSKKDVGIAGGKGASLGEMTDAGIPVPPGFVVLADAFEHLIKKTDINVEIDSLLSRVRHEDINSVEKASSQIRDLIADAQFPEDIAKEVESHFKKLGAKFVAVRSSATAEDSSVASWAGELESYLNIDKNNLLEAVKKCWSSLFTPRAIFYRFEKKLHKTKVSVAVVVQKMVQSEASGIVFTVHPVTKDYGQMVIEAGYGLGEAIVGGRITPDTAVIDKKSWVIMDINISEQSMMIVRKGNGTVEAKVPEAKRGEQKLDNENLLKLARLCGDIEKHYGTPQDIEWAMEGGEFYITQSRPITTL
ncbi:hypothetical protein A2V68_03050 [candidate division Kazan bacterium RBG_13_50_9]|uniref:Phosphoenolpyruvate synthase n=1 Tax=candidate division Kazan bacterium RBG_13_50_9 TaxID=1798535 RepID=A0A1F4NSS8_UNCK3|nr:MAG: hypothetical protein A2V68_03050 [candidate division Kazan bacterium RBG_13_50_9]